MDQTHNRYELTESTIEIVRQRLRELQDSLFLYLVEKCEFTEGELKKDDIKWINLQSKSGKRIHFTYQGPGTDKNIGDTAKCIQFFIRKRPWVQAIMIHRNKDYLKIAVTVAPIAFVTSTNSRRNIHATPLRNQPQPVAPAVTRDSARFLPIEKIEILIRTILIEGIWEEHKDFELKPVTDRSINVVIKIMCNEYENAINKTWRLADTLERKGIKTSNGIGNHIIMPINQRVFLKKL